VPHSDDSELSQPPSKYNKRNIDNDWINMKTEDDISMFKAIEENDFRQFSIILDNFPTVNLNQDPNGKYPLLHALTHHRIDMCHMLIHYGADLNIVDVDFDNNTPLHYCFLHEDLRELSKAMLNNAYEIEVEVNKKNNFGLTPLFLAIYNKNIEDTYILLLLHYGARIDIPNIEDQYPLHIACENENLGLVQLLIEFGANINVPDKNGSTSLHVSAKKENREIVDILLKAKADLTLLDNYGMKPLDYVKTNNQLRKILEDWDPGTKSWKWEINQKDLYIDKDIQLGKGAYGTVYKGKLYYTPVAIKTLTDLSIEAQESVKVEIGLMADIHHPNILILVGTCLHNTFGRCIITEFIDGGSLCNYILNNYPLTMKTMLNCAIDSARGIAWLHSRNPPILHRDLHSNNILVTKHGVCKICDFGLSQIQGSFKENKKIYKRISPPEIEKGRPYTQQADIFMYGLILHELLTKSKSNIVHTSIQYLREVLPQECEKNEDLKTYIEIIQGTVDHNPAKRISFEEILIRLESLLDNLSESQSDIGNSSQEMLIDKDFTLPVFETQSEYKDDDV